MKKIALLSGTAVLLCGAPIAANAADQATSPPVQATGGDESAPQLEEIVITAQRHSEDAQKAALAITAVSGEKLVNSGITAVQQLANVAPALQITSGTGAYTWFAVRGVTNTGANAFADPAVAVNLDGVYLATPTEMQGMMFDLQRVEILKGPQGTLYGRNATAGAINLISRQPTFDTSGEASIELGNYKGVLAQGALNLPLGDKVALRIAGQGSRHDGYYSDGSGDEDLVAARATLLFKPTDKLSVTLSGDFTEQGGRGNGSTVVKDCGGQGCFVVGPWTGLADAAAQFAPLAPKTRNTYLKDHYRGVTGHVDWDIGLATLTVIASHRWAQIHYYSTTTGILIDEDQRPKQSSIEARLASPTDQPLRWLVGGYFLHTDMSARSLTENPPAKSFGDQRTNTGGTAWAAFGQLTWALTDTLRLVGGLRYTTEEKFSKTQRYNVTNTVGPDPVIPLIPTSAPLYSVDETHNWHDTNWKAGVEWDVGPRSLLYANASTGFKAGGFYSGPPGNDTYAPEHLTSYVIGSKNRFLENRLQLNLEAFYLDYRDQQISYTKVVGISSISVTENAGKLTSKGVEVEGNWLVTPTTQLGAQLQYLDAKYDSLTYFTPSPPAAQSLCVLTPGQPGGTTLVNCNGMQALQSPKWTFNGSIDQTIPLASGAKVIAHVNMLTESKRFNHITYIPDTISRPNTRWDASLTYQPAAGAWRVTAFVRNATNTATPTYILPPPGYNNNLALVAVLKPPRTYGIRLQANF